MKYGVIVVTPVSEAKDRSFVNLGDFIQAEAILYVYEQMGIAKEDVVRIDIKDVANYKGEYLLLPININLSLNWIVDIFPMSERIIPVFLGISFFSAEMFPEKVKNYFKMYEPIGCRDEFTLRNMRKNGIASYLYGCVTAVLPKRIDELKMNKIFLVDVPNSFLKYVEETNIEKLGNMEIITHIVGGNKVKDSIYDEELTKELLNRYKKEAKLIITSRLHCMAPCMAMGIPVIPVTDNISPRMAWIDKFLDIYSPDRYCDINWEGQLVEYDEIKRSMLDVAKHKIFEAKKKNEMYLDLSYKYEERKKSLYGNHYYNKLKDLPKERGSNFKYIIWGVGQIGINAYNVIKTQYPDSEMIAAVDSYCTGSFFGCTIQKPDILMADTYEYIFITTTSGENCAKKKMSELGKIEIKDFMSMATTSG